MATLLEKANEILAEKQAKILSTNIKSGVRAFGVDGELPPINNQDKTILENGTYTADAGYTGLGEVTVNVDSIPKGIFIQDSTPQSVTGDSFWIKEMPVDTTLSELVPLDVSYGGAKWRSVLENASQEDINDWNDNTYIFIGKTYSYSSDYYFVSCSRIETLWTNSSYGWLKSYNLYNAKIFHPYGNNYTLTKSDVFQNSRGSTSSSPDIGFSNTDIYITETHSSQKLVLWHANDVVITGEDGIYILVNNKRYILYTNKGYSTFNKILDTSNANAIASNLLLNKTAYVGNTKITGTMPNNGTLNITPTTSQQTISSGYTSGGTVSAVTFSIDSNIQEENIKDGVTILGITGTLKEGTDTSDATATANDILIGKTAYVNGSKITGTYESTANAIRYSSDKDLYIKNLTYLYDSTTQKYYRTPYDTSLTSVGAIKTIYKTLKSMIKADGLYFNDGVSYWYIAKYNGQYYVAIATYPDSIQDMNYQPTEEEMEMGMYEKTYSMYSEHLCFSDMSGMILVRNGASHASYNWEGLAGGTISLCKLGYEKNWSVGNQNSSNCVSENVTLQWFNASSPETPQQEPLYMSMNYAVTVPIELSNSIVSNLDEVNWFQDLEETPVNCATMKRFMFESMSVPDLYFVTQEGVETPWKTSTYNNETSKWEETYNIKDGEPINPMYPRKRCRY